MPGKISTIIHSAPVLALAAWVRYLYFLRFGIFLLILPVVLCWLNDTGARSLTSGIVTPVRCLQYLCASFFLIAAGFVSLIQMRIVVSYGKERFGEEPPPLLQWLFDGDPMPSHTGNRWLDAHKGLSEWLALLVSQLGNLRMFIYFFTNGAKEQVDPTQIAEGLLLGLFFAGLFWFSVNFVYYLTYQSTAVKDAHGNVPSDQAARTLIVPRSLFLSHDGQGHRSGDILEDACTGKWPHLLRRFFPTCGYKDAHGGLHPEQYFASVATFGFFGLYLVLWPLTAPIPVPGWSYAFLFLYILGGLILSLTIATAHEGRRQDRTGLIVWKILLALSMFLFSAAFLPLYRYDDGERFPILALVLILLISVTGILGALSYFFDRYRVPVLTLAILITVLPRYWNWDHGHEEHYLSIALRDQPAPALHTPAEILTQKLNQLDKRDSKYKDTLIVVTSTGGGIHAAVWTASILEELEAKFAADADLSAADSQHNPTFHDHVLLMSTVSGGSAGLYTYLRELDPIASGGKPQWDRMYLEAQCSSLEAVGWGLVYYDIPKAIVPFFPYLIAPSSGVRDLERSPLRLKDRTWALRRAFARNLNDPYCQTVYAENPNQQDTRKLIPLSDLIRSNRENEPAEKELNAGNFDPLDSSGGIPAFTMNTTTVEGGYRFLSANYYVPTHPPDPLYPEPAESFLKVYRDIPFTDPTKKIPGTLYPDLPLATAAQMSATFPYVSSAATFPHVHGQTGVHFVDGGYYDNDGTSSAIEFLRYALSDSAAKVRIVLVEIRNSPDDTTAPECRTAWHVNPCGKNKLDSKRWNLLGQALAPLEAFYGAGHESVTDRNRNILRLLESAYQDRLVLNHFILEDLETLADPNKPGTDPLNWSLTPKQQIEVRNYAQEKVMTDRYAAILACFKDSNAKECPKETDLDPVNRR